MKKNGIIVQVLCTSAGLGLLSANKAHLILGLQAKTIADGVFQDKHSVIIL